MGIWQRLLVAGFAVVGLTAVVAVGATAASTKVIHVGDTNNNSLNDNQSACLDAGGMITSWHFVINGLKKGIEKPEAIEVAWSDNSTQTVELDSENINAKVGHYTVAAPAVGVIVTDATAEVAESWSGQFVLSHVTCETTIASANVTLTKSLADGFGGQPGTGLACFTLTPAAGSSDAVQCHTFAPGEEFTFAWNDLPEGSYGVRETTTPPGYAPIEDQNFTVRTDCAGASSCFDATDASPTYSLGGFVNQPAD